MVATIVAKQGHRAAMKEKKASASAGKKPQGRKTRKGLSAARRAERRVRAQILQNKGDTSCFESDDDEKIIVVGYDSPPGPTKLYKYIERMEWESAAKRARQVPKEATIWVERREKAKCQEKADAPDASKSNAYIESRDDRSSGDRSGGNGEGKKRKILFRILPLHAAVIFGAPLPVVKALMLAHPDGAMALDDKGSLPIHIACSTARYDNDSNKGEGRKREHGAGSFQRAPVVDALLDAHPTSIEAKDGCGKTPIELAEQRIAGARGIGWSSLFRGDWRKNDDTFMVLRKYRMKLENQRRQRLLKRRQQYRRKWKDSSPHDGSVTCSSLSDSDDYTETSSFDDDEIEYSNSWSDSFIDAYSDDGSSACNVSSSWRNQDNHVNKDKGSNEEDHNSDDDNPAGNFLDQRTSFAERLRQVQEARTAAESPEAVVTRNGVDKDDVSLAAARAVLSGPPTAQISEGDLLEPDEATKELIAVVRSPFTSDKNEARRTNALGAVRMVAFRGTASDRARLVATRGLIAALAFVLLMSPQVDHSATSTNFDAAAVATEQRRRCVSTLVYLSDLPLLRFFSLLSPGLIRGGLRDADRPLRRATCVLLSFLTRHSNANRTVIGENMEVMTALVDIIDQDGCADDSAPNRSESVIIGHRSQGSGDVDVYECIPAQLANSSSVMTNVVDGYHETPDVDARIIAMKVLLSVSKVPSVAHKLVQPRIMSALVQNAHRTLDVCSRPSSSSATEEAIISFAALTNLTRHPKNAKQLVYQVKGFVALMAEVIAPNSSTSASSTHDEVLTVDSRLRKCALRSIQNLSCNRSCRQQLAWVHPRLLRGIVTECNAVVGVDVDLRRSAFNTLRHLTDMPANLLVLLSTRGFVDILLRVAKNPKEDKIARYLASDSLATLSYLLRVSAEKGSGAKIGVPGSASVKKKETWAPTLDCKGWKQWE